MKDQRNKILIEENTAQLRGVYERLKDVEKTSNESKDRIRILPFNAIEGRPSESIVYGMINLINVGDFAFDDAGYNKFTYAGAADSCAEWYIRDGSIEAFWTQSVDATKSAQALDINAGADKSFWNKVSGDARIGANTILGQKLTNNYASRGNRIFVRFEAAKVAGATIADSLQARVSIFDNTAAKRKIIEGGLKNLTTAVQGTAGTFTRKYILKTVLSSGEFYYSDVTAAGGGTVINALSVNNNTNQTVNYVNVSWSAVIEQAAYILYRHDSEFNEWRQIAEIVNGTPSFRDAGGRNGTIPLSFPPAQINARATAVIKNFGIQLRENLQEAVFSIRIPSEYVYAETDPRSQWLQIEFLKSDGTPATALELSNGGIIIDKVGFSFAGGRWLPSAKDQQTTAAITTTAPPPPPPPPPPSSGTTSGGGGDTYDGGGSFGCVTLDTMVRSFDESTMTIRDVPAGVVYVGMILLGVNKNGDMAMSRVREIYHSKTNKLYIFTTENNRMLPCSPTHPIIQNIEDRKGKSAYLIENDDEVLTSPSGTKIEQSRISSIETLHSSKLIDTVTFSMEEMTMTIITNGIVSHNLDYKDRQLVQA